MQIYITDKSEKKFWRTQVASLYATGERNNMLRRLEMIKLSRPGFTFVDAETAHIVEEDGR